MSHGSAIDPIMHVKDGLRRFRYRMRQAAAGETEPPPSFPTPRLPQPLALVADSMLSVAEAARHVLIPDFQSHAVRVPLSIHDYVERATNPSDTSQGFSAAYYEFKAVTLRFGAREALISERALEQARRGFVGGLRPREDAHQSRSSVAETIRACAALTVAFAKARPIQRIEFDEQKSQRARHFADDPNAFVACAIGLSAYIVASAKFNKPRDAGSAILTAEVATDTHFARLNDALLGANPIEAVSAEFAKIVSFL